MLPTRHLPHLAPESTPKSAKTDPLPHFFPKHLSKKEEIEAIQRKSNQHCPAEAAQQVCPNKPQVDAKATRPRSEAIPLRHEGDLKSRTGKLLFESAKEDGKGVPGSGSGVEDELGWIGARLLGYYFTDGRIEGGSRQLIVNFRYCS